MRLAIFSLLSALPALIAATPFPANAEGNVAAPLADEAKVEMFSSDTCGGAVDTVMLVGSGSYRCVAVTNKRSIRAPILK